MDKNLKTYSSKNVVSYYKKYDTLQKPEETILNILHEKLKEMNMLDIGIGAGRTTRYFAPIVKNYTGIDYSQNMIDACIKKFEGKLSNCSFYTEDARVLKTFKDGSFDFALFSFNGIDYVLPEERDSVLLQIKRVLRKDGIFCFSSHNIGSLLYMPLFEFRLNVFASIKRIFEVVKMKKLNKKQFDQAAKANYIVINDGAHNYGLNTCYIRPSFQLEQLKTIGFSEVKIYSFSTGKELYNKKLIDSTTEKWFYYLCSI